MGDDAEGCIAVRNPRTGAVDAQIVPPSPAELAERCAALRLGQVQWEARGLDGRIAAMLKWADAIEEIADEIGTAEEIDTGRRRVAREVPLMVAGSVRGWCAQAPDVIERARLSGTSSAAASVTYETEFDPYPLLGVISPWNHPFLLSTLDAVPALLAGCAVIVKPSEITPRFVTPVTESIRSVPELAAAFGYVTGAGETGQELIRLVDAVCFTGSVATGRKIAVTCAERFIPCFLELGGKDAAVVTATADVDQAAAAVLKGAVHNNGQLCFSTERVYVDEAIAEPFVAELVRLAGELEPNFPDIAHGHLGPFILGRQADIVDDHLADAIAQGAQIECGGPTTNLGGGRYMDPTVLTGVTHDMKIMREETFGPVIPVMAYASVEEGIALANDSDFGLSGAVIAGTVDEARAVAHQIHAGAMSLQDTSLTINIMRDVEKTSYALSGLAGSRMVLTACSGSCAGKRSSRDAVRCPTCRRSASTPAPRGRKASRGGAKGGRRTGAGGLIGSGTIGGGWAATYLARGRRVLVIDPDPNAQARLTDFLHTVWPMVHRGISESSPTVPLDLLDFGTFADLRAVALVHESAPEDAAIKRRIYAQVEKTVGVTTIIASSSGGLMPSDLQAEMAHPHRFAVAHPFSPVYALPLVEVLAGAATTTDTIDALVGGLRALGKHPIVLRKEAPGYLTNRLTFALLREAVHCLAEELRTPRRSRTPSSTG